MHLGFVNLDNEKMSKSLDNFFTIREVLKKYDGETLRYFIMSSHYRSPLNFSDENLDNAKSALTRIYTSIRGLSSTEIAMNQVSMRFDFESRFNSALDDDFNTPIALSILFEIVKIINTERDNDTDLAKALSQLLKKLGSYIGILESDSEEYLKQGAKMSDKEIEDKIKQRNTARNNKDFPLSDQIRDELADIGIVLEDNADGTTWRKT
jgi:cysteinyl-tRNA synthetase